MLSILNGIVKRLSRCFLAGLLAVLPLVLTVGIVVWAAAIVKEYIGPHTFIGQRFSALGVRLGSGESVAYAIGWIAVLGAIFALGVLVEMGAKRYLSGLVNGVIKRIPIAGSVYGSLQQVVDMFDRKDEADLKAMSVVFCYFGNREGPGALALMPSSERFPIEGREYQVVIIPTAPVPFGGALLFVPVECIQPLDMSVDGLMSIYVSMGVTTPEYLCDKSKGQTD
jgi:uncharacterized membrane protein